LPNIDGFVESLNSIEGVIPAKAGIQLFQYVLDPGFRRGDAQMTFHETIKYWGNDIFWKG
jgi:hypothetical protein